MNFFIVNKDGSENGPITQEALIGMAKNKEIHANTEVRNELIKKANPAEKLPFLTDLFPKKNKGSEKAGLRDPLSRSSNAIKTASFGYRSGAAFIDIAIIYGFIFSLAYFINSALASGSITAGSASAYVLAGAFFITLAYYTINIGFFAQTPGQRFYGIMAVNKVGSSVLLNQALVYSFLLTLLFPLAPLVVYLTKKSLQEFLSGVQIVNVRLG